MTYCGRTPPVVILEVDHIIPVADGGDDGEANLVTACFDCNRGKGRRSLDSVPKSLQEHAGEEALRREQLAQYNDFLLECRDQDAETMRELGNYWFNFFLEEDAFVFGNTRKASVKRFLKWLAPAQLLEFMDIAHSRWPVQGENDDRTWRYFCGICWTNIREATDGSSTES